jgi:hypothetical protein
MGYGQHADSEAETLASGLISQVVSTQQTKPDTATTDQPAVNPFANSVSQTAGQGGQKLLIKRTSAEGMLVSLIKQSVQPDSWEDTNGDASLIIVGGLMVVTQTQQALDDIHALTSELEDRLSRNE